MRSGLGTQTRISRFQRNSIAAICPAQAPGGCFSAPTHASRKASIAAPFAAPYLVTAGTTPEKSVPTGPQNRLDKADSSRDHRCSLTQWNLATALIAALRGDTPGPDCPGMRSRVTHRDRHHFTSKRVLGKTREEPPLMRRKRRRLDCPPCGKTCSSDQGIAASRDACSQRLCVIDF
jgi:hypothetical protein